MSRYQPMRLLPQTAGFRFRALLVSGEEVVCRLSRDATGDLNVSGVPMGSIRSWRAL